MWNLYHLENKFEKEKQIPSQPFLLLSCHPESPMASADDKMTDNGEIKAMSNNRVKENGNAQDYDERPTGDSKDRSSIKEAYTWICTLLLLINYFLAQYDKFILSYFSTELSESLNL